MSMMQFRGHSMEGKICLVTGASRGIGFQTAMGLAKKGAFVVLASHNRQRGEKASHRINAYVMKNVTHFMLVDLSSQAQIREFAEAFRDQYDHLDVLVNNVGGFFLKRRETVDGIEMTLALNHLSYFMTTLLLMDRLLSSDSARIVNVSSEAHRGREINFDDLQFRHHYNGMRAYGQSKLANLLFTYELERRLTNTGITVNAANPGFVRSQLGKQNEIVRGVMEIIDLFAKSPAQGAQTSIYLASDPKVEGVTGQYFFRKKPVESSPESHDPGTAARLWEVSEELCNLESHSIRFNDSGFVGYEATHIKDETKGT